MGHWYTKDGKSMHFIVGKNGKERATTLRDARKLDLVPSVTEILNLLNKPALTNWLVNQAYMSALTLPKNEGETIDDFKKRAEIDAKKESIEARDLGSEIHQNIENAFLGKPYTKHEKTVNSVIDYITELTGTNDFTPEVTFSSPAGYGGMIDLVGDNVVIDYKTKDFDDPEKVKGYDENCMQLSAYAHGILMPDARKINIFISRNVPGLVAHHEWDVDYFDRFECLLKYWHITKQLDLAYVRDQQDS